MSGAIVACYEAPASGDVTANLDERNSLLNKSSSSAPRARVRLRHRCRPPAPPVALCVAGGDGVAVRPRLRVRAPWAGGGPDGGPETDAHRGIIGR